MPIKMKKPSDASFELTIEDTFDPNEDYVVEVMDMDTADFVSKIDGKPYTSLLWTYRIFDKNGIAFVDQASGEAWEGRAFSSLSLSGKAKARGWASAFIGHELTDEECDRIADDFDGAIVGKRARVSFKVEPKKSDTGEVLGHNLVWAFVRPMPASRQRPAAERQERVAAANNATTAGTVTNINAPRQTTTAASAGRETPAQKRARLEAELAAMEDDDQEDTGSDDDPPF